MKKFLKTFKFTIIALIACLAFFFYNKMTNNPDNPDSVNSTKPLVISKTDKSSAAADTTAKTLPDSIANLSNVTAVTDEIDFSELDINTLITKLKSNNDEEILEALEAISDSEDESSKVQKALIALLEKTTNAEVKIAVLDTTFMFDSKSIMLDSFNKLLIDENADVREAAIDQMTEIENIKMMEYLIAALDNQYEDVRENAVIQLKVMASLELEDPQAWKNWWKTNSSTFKFE